VTKRGDIRPLPLSHYKVPPGGAFITPSDAALIVDKAGNMTMLTPSVGVRTVPQKLLGKLAAMLNKPTKGI